MDHSGVVITGAIGTPGATSSYACTNCHTGTTQNSVLIIGQVNDGNDVKDHVINGTRQIQCQQCHTFASFGGASNHVDTAANPAAPYPTSKYPNAFAGATLPTGAPRCDSCHAQNGGATWKMANHIPPNATVTPTGTGLGQTISADCYACHRSVTQAAPWPVPANFAGGTLDHYGLGVTGSCTVCHDTTGTYSASSGAQGLNAVANHIPTNNVSCEGCHLAYSGTTDVTSFSALKVTANDPKMQHSQTTLPCSSCHKAVDTKFANQTVKGLSATPSHIPTTAECDTCHNNKTTGNYTSFAGTAINHSKAGITNNCASCHNGATYAGNQTPKSKASVTGHISTTKDCSSSGCHDKATNGRTAATTDCPSAFGAYQCWGDGLYPHTETTACGNCHTGPGVYGTTVLTSGHIPVKTGTSCELCHIVSLNGSTSPVIAKYTVWSSAVIQHFGVDTASCSTCHGGTYQAASKDYNNIFSQPANYEPTNKATFFKGIGVARTAVSPAHVSTASDCRTCHGASMTTYADWKNATYDHQGVTSGCANSGCHDGTNAAPRAGKSATAPAHLATTQDCSLCHLTSFGTGVNAYKGWGSATMKHSGMNFTSQPCNSCHADKTIATPPTYRFQGPTPPGYIEPSNTTTNHTATTHQATAGADCKSCHQASMTDFSSWAGAGFDHKDSTDPTGYRTKNCSASGCHDGTNAAPKSGKSATAPVHVPTTADCSQCHVNALYPSTKMYTLAGWAGTKFNHTTTAARCDTCHGAVVTYQGGVTPKTMTAASPNHVPISQLTAAQNNCVVCHVRPAAEQTSGYYSAWSGGIMYHTTITASCASCHGGGKTYAGNQPKTTLSVPSLTHVSTTSPAVADCSSCHGASIPPDNGSNPVTYKPWSGGKFHNRSGVTNVTTGCAVCHTAAGTTILGATGMVFKDPANGAGHIPNPANLSCERCHNGNAMLFTTWSGTGIGMSHSGITTNCKSCHNGILAMGAPPSTNPGGSTRFPANIAAPSHSSLTYVNSATCEKCHFNGTSTITAYSGSTLNSSLWKLQQVTWDGSAVFTPPAATANPPGIAPICGSWHQGTSPLPTGSCNACHAATGSSTKTTNTWMAYGPRNNSASHGGGQSCDANGDCHGQSGARPSATQCRGKGFPN
ncbi:MAG: hypothetical protein FIA97_01185 [Methylococcaceae bacterium]|nr:hypothetical protein [Methylococcaceae bacterium]